MATPLTFDWNAFLADDGLLPLSTDPHWPDLTTTSGHSIDMPPSTSALRAAAGTASSTGLSNYESALNTNDRYFDDCFPSGEYFLGDLDTILQPFGTAIAGEGSPTDSSPEPTTGLAYGTLCDQSKDMPSSSQTPASTTSGSNQSPVLPSVQAPAIMLREPQPSQTYPNPPYESMFPNSMDTGFVEDLTFPNGPNGPPATSKANLDNNNPKPVANMTTKRNKAQGKPDILSACWTSPLCPNHDQDGPPPNPSNCGSACAPFLFDESLPAATADRASSSETRKELEDIQEEGVVEIKSRPPRKRRESGTAGEPSGRQFTTTTDPQFHLKSEQESASPPEPPATEEKSKGRRRLPHNQVERKYRESLNTQLDSLRRVVPALQQHQRPCDSADIEDLPTPSKPSKAVILASATAYIKQMEKDKQALADENAQLKRNVKALQALVQCDGCTLMQYFVDMKVSPPQR